MGAPLMWILFFFVIVVVHMQLETAAKKPETLEFKYPKYVTSVLMVKLS